MSEIKSRFEDPAFFVAKTLKEHGGRKLTHETIRSELLPTPTWVNGVGSIEIVRTESEGPGIPGDTLFFRNNRNGLVNWFWLKRGKPHKAGIGTTDAVIVQLKSAIA